MAYIHKPKRFATEGFITVRTFFGKEPKLRGAQDSSFIVLTFFSRFSMEFVYFPDVAQI